MENDLEEKIRHRPVRFGLMGTPLTSGNRGVQALASSLVRLCLDVDPRAEVLVFGSHPRREQVTLRPLGEPFAVQVVHWRLSPRGGWRNHLLVIFLGSALYRAVPLAAVRRYLARAIPWIGQLETVDLIGDIRGGDSFSDIYGFKRLAVQTLPVLAVMLVKRQFVLFPQTFGPFRGRAARWIGRLVVRQSTRVFARDEASQRVAQQLARPDQIVGLMPDVAFSLHADGMTTAQFDDAPAASPIPANAVGLNVNGLLYNGGYDRKGMFGLALDYPAFVRQVATRLLETHDGPLILLPHTYAPTGDVESDNDACLRVKAALPEALRSRTFVVTGDYDAHQLKGIVAQCIFFVGSRMHSCIAALSQGVPCVGVAYSMKFRGVFETVGAGAWVIDARSTATDDAVAQVLARLAESGPMRADLRAQADAARGRLRASFRTMVAGPVAPADARPAST